MQLSLLRPPALELTERGRAVPPHILGLYSVFLSHVRQLRCAGRIADVGRRRPRSTIKGWTNADVKRLLGVDRRVFPWFERAALIAWEGSPPELLALPRYHRSAEWRDEQEDDRLRRQGRKGGIESGKSRRERSKEGSERGGDPDRKGGGIRSVILSVLADLARTQVRSGLTPLPAGGQIPDRGPGDPLWGGSENQPRTKVAPSASAPSAIQRKAAAPKRALAARVVRRTAEKSAGLAPGGRASSPRGSSRAKTAAREADGSQRASKRGGPDFGLAYNLWRRRTGKPWRREKAAELWTRLDMSSAERRAFVRCVQEAVRVYGEDFRSPNMAAFLEYTWKPAVQSVREKARPKGQPTPADELITAVFHRLGRVS